MLYVEAPCDCRSQASAYFSDNMVFQQNQSIRIWGWADKKESVEVRFLDQVKKVKADKDGRRQVELSLFCMVGLMN